MALNMMCNSSINATILGRVAVRVNTISHPYATVHRISVPYLFQHHHSRETPFRRWGGGRGNTSPLANCVGVEIVWLGQVWHHGRECGMVPDGNRCLPYNGQSLPTDERGSGARVG